LHPERRPAVDRANCKPGARHRARRAPQRRETGRWHTECLRAVHVRLHRRRAMTDLVLIVVTVVFFAVAIAYAAGCDRI
jgi:hypothetical protein